LFAIGIGAWIYDRAIGQLDFARRYGVNCPHGRLLRFGRSFHAGSRWCFFFGIGYGA
jgi:hypothetical protein